jgi:hypothetical protein
MTTSFASIAEAVAYYLKRGYTSTSDQAPFTRWMKSATGQLVRIEQIDFLTVKVSPEND